MQYLLKILTTSAYGMKLKSVGGNKESAPLAVMAAEIVILAFKDRTPWPLDFIDVYIDDAINCRMWVDAKESSSFTKILLSFANESPLPMEPLRHTSDLADDSSSGEEEVVESSAKNITDSDEGKSLSLLRFEPAAARSRLVQLVRGCLVEGRAKTNTFSLIETLTDVCSVTEIRPLMCAHLEKWANNPAFSAALKALIERTASNIARSYASSDNPLILSIVRTRPHIKAEDYRAVLQVLMGGCSTLAAITLKSVLQLDDPQLKQLKPETAKLISSIFQNTAVTTNKAELLSEVVVLVHQELKSSWSPLQSKTLIDVVLRLARTAPTLSSMMRELMVHLSKHSTFWKDASLDSDAFKLFTELFHSIIQSLVNDVMSIEKDSVHKSSKATHAERSKPLSRPSSSLFISRATAKAPRQDVSKSSASEEEKKIDPALASQYKDDLLTCCSHLQTIILQTVTALVSNNRRCIKFNIASDLISRIHHLSNVASSVKSNADLGSSSNYIKDRGFVSVEGVLHIARLLQMSASSLEEMSAGVDMVEAMLHRGLRTRILYEDGASASKVCRGLSFKWNDCYDY